MEAIWIQNGLKDGVLNPFLFCDVFWVPLEASNFPRVSVDGAPGEASAEPRVGQFLQPIPQAAPYIKESRATSKDGSLHGI